MVATGDARTTQAYLCFSRHHGTVLRHRRGQEALETLLIFVAGLSVLSLTVGWGYSRYAVASSTMNMSSARHAGEKMYAGVSLAYSRGNDNEYRFKLGLPRSIVLHIENNATDLRVDYSRSGGTAFHIFHRQFPFLVNGASSVDVRGDQEIHVSITANVLTIKCITQEGELCPAA